MSDLLLILVLILGGMLLILAEICTPAFGLLAVAAIICFGVVIYKCFMIAPFLGFTAIIVILAGLPIYLTYLMKVFPKTPLGKRLMLRRRNADTGAGVPRAAEQADLLGAEGVASSVLRPSGTVTVDGRRLTATAETGFIEAGTAVRVVQASGINIVVRALPAEAADQDAQA